MSLHSSTSRLYRMFCSCPSATVIVRSGGLFWLKPVAMVLLMLYSTVLVEWLPLKSCCVKMCVMYESSVFSSVLQLLREVRWV